MHELTSFFLGLLQGLTEFIPVSSSGHLVIAEHFFGSADHMFIEFINLGTLAALLVYYRHMLRKIIIDITKHKNYKLARNILLTSIPAGLVGLLLTGFIEKSAFFTNIYVVLTALTLVGVIMIVLDRLPKMSEVKDGAHLSWKRALGIGFAQMFALIPGVSRSGSTIITGRLFGLSSSQAADYSFLASIPIMLAVTVKLFARSSDRAYFFDNLPSMIIGNLAAFIVGLIAINFLLRYLKKYGLRAFGWYRVILSVVVLGILLLQF
jgi:undecaprenyl-diphosphatase